MWDKQKDIYIMVEWEVLKKLGNNSGVYQAVERRRVKLYPVAYSRTGRP